jgi:hypothetical protein
MPLAERHVAVERTEALLAVLPPGWLAAARAAALALAALAAGQLAPPALPNALHAMLPQLGWQWAGRRCRWQPVRAAAAAGSLYGQPLLYAGSRHGAAGQTCSWGPCGSDGASST